MKDKQNQRIPAPPSQVVAPRRRSACTASCSVCADARPQGAERCPESVPVRALVGQAKNRRQARAFPPKHISPSKHGGERGRYGRGFRARPSFQPPGSSCAFDPQTPGADSLRRQVKEPYSGRPRRDHWGMSSAAGVTCRGNVSSSGASPLNLFSTASTHQRRPPMATSPG